MTRWRTLSLLLVVLCCGCSGTFLDDCEDFYSPERCAEMAATEQRPSESRALSSVLTPNPACQEEADSACRSLRAVVREVAESTHKAIHEVASSLPPDHPYVAAWRVSLQLGPEARSSLSQLSRLPPLAEIAAQLRTAVADASLEEVSPLLPGSSGSRAGTCPPGCPLLQWAITWRMASHLPPRWAPYLLLALAFAAGCMFTLVAQRLLCRSAPPPRPQPSHARQQSAAVAGRSTHHRRVSSGRNARAMAAAMPRPVKPKPAHDLDSEEGEEGDDVDMDDEAMPDLPPSLWSLVHQVMRGCFVLLVLVMCVDIAMNWWSDFVSASIENHLLASGATAPDGCAELLQSDAGSASLLARTRWAIAEWTGSKHPCLDHAKAIHKQEFGPMAALSEVRWRQGVENAIVGVLFGWLAPASRTIGEAFYAVWSELPWLARFPILGALFLFLIFRNKSFEVFGKLPFVHVGARVIHGSYPQQAQETHQDSRPPPLPLPRPHTPTGTPRHRRALSSRTPRQLLAPESVPPPVKRPLDEEDGYDQEHDYVVEEPESSEPDAVVAAAPAPAPAPIAASVGESSPPPLEAPDSSESLLSAAAVVVKKEEGLSASV